MVNYWWQVDKASDGSFTLVIKANSDTINVVEHFKEEQDADFYAEAYIRGYKDARGEA